MYRRWTREPVTQAVFLESFEATGFGGDPGMIAEYLLAETDLPLVWAARSPRPATPRVRPASTW
jgi:hypothetical protein